MVSSSAFLTVSSLPQSLVAISARAASTSCRVLPYLRVYSFLLDYTLISFASTQFGFQLLGIAVIISFLDSFSSVFAVLSRSSFPLILFSFIFFLSFPLWVALAVVTEPPCQQIGFSSVAHWKVLLTWLNTPIVESPLTEQHHPPEIHNPFISISCYA